MIKEKIKGMESALIIDESERQYFLGYKSSFGYLLILEKMYFFVDSRYINSAKQELEPQGVEVLLYNGLESVKEILEKHNVKRLGLDYTLTTIAELKNLKELDVKFKNIRTILENAFAIKSSEELQNIRVACQIAEKAYSEILRFISRGVTEKSIADKLDSLMNIYGADKPSFDTIVAFGENTATPHHQSGKTILRDNMPVLMDFGCKYNGYCSDCTRTIFCGKPTEKFLKVYMAVQNANMLAERKIKHGTTFNDADSYAREYLKLQDLDQYFTHSLGHGIGINIHEYPYLSPKPSKERVYSGMVFSIEPGVYIDGEFGVRIEDTCVISGRSVERLFKDSKNLIII